MAQSEDNLKPGEKAFSNCHRNGEIKITSTEDYNASDRDSALVKEVRAYRTPLVNRSSEDSENEERRDGPGGD